MILTWWSPDLLDEWDDVEEELFGQFWFSADHETLEETTSLRNELVDRVLGQTDSMAQINGSDVIQFALLDHLLEDLYIVNKVNANTIRRQMQRQCKDNVGTECEERHPNKYSLSKNNCILKLNNTVITLTNKT